MVDKACYSNFTNCTASPSTIPDHIYFDRVYVHGDATHDVQSGIMGNFSNFAVVDSYVSDIHMKGTDTQAVGGYETPGPIKLVNNHLEAAGENVLFGGSGRGWGGFVASDIEVRNNYLYKPLSWVTPSTNGTIVVKNLFELKSAQRVLFDNNVLENIWTAGQAGSAFLFTIRSSQSGDVAVVEDVTVTNNIFKNVVTAFNTLAVDYNCGTTAYPSCTNAGNTDRLVIKNNLILLGDNTQPGYSNGQHIGTIVYNGSWDVPHGSVYVGMKDVLVQHNTTVAFGTQRCWAGNYFGVPGTWPPPPWPTPISNNIWILDNVDCRQMTGGWGSQGQAALNNYMGQPNTPPNDVTSRFYGNVMLVPTGDKAYAWPSNDTAVASITYKNPANGDYTLVSPVWNGVNTSDGKMSGYDPTQFGKNPPTLTPAQVAQITADQNVVSSDQMTVTSDQIVVSNDQTAITNAQAALAAAQGVLGTDTVTLTTDTSIFNSYLATLCQSTDGHTYQAQQIAGSWQCVLIN
jgi:hypothetical protein